VTGPAARLLDQPAVAAFDRWVDTALEPLRGHAIADRVFSTASHLGDWALIWHVVGTVRGLRSERNAGEALQLTLLLAAESVIVNQGMKRLFRRERPTPAGESRHGLRTPRTSSFPSGHASAAFFSAGVLTRRSPRLAPLWYSIAVVVALSRPFVRIHHGSDIVGGAVVGATLARIATRILP